MLDDMDIKIPAILQADCTRPVADIARKWGCRPRPAGAHPEARGGGCHSAARALLDPHKVNAGVTVIVSIKDRPPQRGVAGSASITRVQDLPEVVEFYRMSATWITCFASSCRHRSLRRLYKKLSAASRLQSIRRPLRWSR